MVNTFLFRVNAKDEQTITALQQAFTTYSVANSPISGRQRVAQREEVFALALTLVFYMMHALARLAAAPDRQPLSRPPSGGGRWIAKRGWVRVTELTLRMARRDRPLVGVG